ncbi:MAG: tRNA (adenosine(37)-N6)-threonylcarbamoyltransferase complex dimerization subunit type 1 TsaB [Phycisphaerales bacterium JB059]
MRPGQFILAIETSNPTMGEPGVALGRVSGEGVEVLDEEPLRAGSRRGDDLIPAIDRVTRRHDLPPARIGRVLVSTGPGGFTALRIAIAGAKMLGESLGAEVVPVPTALVIAEGLDRGQAPVLICLASKGTTTFGVRLVENAWTQRPEPVGVIGADRLGELGVRTLVGDEHLPEEMRRRAGSLGVTVTPPRLSASALLRVGHAMAPVDPLELAPIYPREPEAVRKWRELHG